jgi:hypothetical protein
MMSNDRPTGVTIISAYYLIFGVATVAWNVLRSVFGVVLCFLPGILVGGVWGLVTGVLNIILGASLYAGRDWTPPVVSILAIIGIVTNVLDGLTLVNIVQIVVNVLVLVYMQSDQVKQFVRTH